MKAVTPIECVTQGLLHRPCVTSRHAMGATESDKSHACHARHAGDEDVRSSSSPAADVGLDSPSGFASHAAGMVREVAALALSVPLEQFTIAAALAVAALI